MFDYNEAPSDEIFNEVKEKAIEIRKTYDDTYGYATEKINRIKEIHNIRDNLRYIVGMFDAHNQIKLLSLLSKNSREILEKGLIMYYSTAFNDE